jgi:hypothetical protein
MLKNPGKADRSVASKKFRTITEESKTQIGSGYRLTLLRPHDHADKGYGQIV